LYITRFLGAFQGFSGIYRIFIGFGYANLGDFPNKFRLKAQPVGGHSMPAPRTWVVMQDGALLFTGACLIDVFTQPIARRASRGGCRPQGLILVVAAMQSRLIIAAGGAAGIAGA
jgi:hypothetical protein